MRMICNSRFCHGYSGDRSDVGVARVEHTLNLLSCSTRLIAASSLLGCSLVWKTTPKEPLPTILHWVYCISLVSPVRPSWTFSRMVSAHVSVLMMSAAADGRTHPPCEGC